MESFQIINPKSGFVTVVIPQEQTPTNSFKFETTVVSNGMTLENKRLKLKKSKPMNLQKQVFTRRAMQFSLKNPNYPTSLIRVRFNINGKRGSYYLPSSYRIESIYWDAEAGCAITDPKRNPKLKGNPYLQTILSNVNREIEKTASALVLAVESLKTRDIIPTCTLVKAELTKRLKGEDKIVETKREFKSFIEFIDYYIELCREGQITNSKGGKLTNGSVRNYLSTQSALRRYTATRKVKLTFEAITIDFYNDFIAFLNDSTHARGKYKPNVIGKFIKEIKVMMRYAHENGYTLNEDFKNRHFKVLQEQAETVYLNEEELAALYALELPVNKAQIRDNFLISCYTSLRYSDISRLERRHINFDNNTIVITTQKTGAVVVIPIHPIVKDILSYYDNQPPKAQCNQVTNRVIKDLCRSAGIILPVNIMETRGGEKIEVTYEKCQLVSSHTARRSFATNAFKSGMPTLSIMQITGHKTESSFMRYIRVSKEENAATLQSHAFFNHKNL